MHIVDLTWWDIRLVCLLLYCSIGRRGKISQIILFIQTCFNFSCFIMFLLLLCRVNRMKQWSCVELDWLCINVFLLINIYIHIAVKKKTWIPIQEFRIVLCLYLIMIYFYKIWFLNTTLVWSCVTTLQYMLAFMASWLNFHYFFHKGKWLHFWVLCIHFFLCVLVMSCFVLFCCFVILFNEVLFKLL